MFPNGEDMFPIGQSRLSMFQGTIYLRLGNTDTAPYLEN